jgi:uncharacterized SAM-binding protein YcdF (DUF218 family)
MSTVPLYATSPLPYALVLLVALAVAWRWLPGWLRGVGVALEIVLLALTMPIGANTLARMASLRSVPACAAPQPATIVVLGGGFEYVPRSAADFGALHLATLDRVFAGVDLWRRIPDAQMVFAGGAGWSIKEAAPMANLALALGVPPDAIRVEAASRTTWQNARNVAALAPPVPRRIWLVTSALHLPRALGAFRAWGFDPCAWPSTRSHRVHAWPGAFVPQGGAIATAGTALHELVGRVEYAALAWWHRRHAAGAQTP